MTDLTAHWTGLAALLIFFTAYILVICEEVIELRKSKPVLLAAGLIWILVAIGYNASGAAEAAQIQAKDIILEYGELLLFLLVAITYVNVLEERRVFEALRARIVGLGLSYRSLFWLTGAIAFPLSSVLDNLTTALVIGAVVTALGAGSRRFVALGCINIVVAANAGGAFSPFGDITTLMVWQNGKLAFSDFFSLLLPALVNWALPAALMHRAVPQTRPEPKAERMRMKPGARGVILLFAATIVTAVSFKNFLNLPPAMGMMLGLGYLQLWSYYLTRSGKRRSNQDMVLDSFKEIQRVEFDTLLFFFGIICAVGGLAAMGYLAMTSNLLYVELGPTPANIAIGALSAIIDNIPLMFAVLKMDPLMSNGEWLLVTLTCGVGGSILSIGSAAGIALMGQAKGVYTFFSHFRWSWAIVAGYAASILVHMWINAASF